MPSLVLEASIFFFHIQHFRKLQSYIVGFQSSRLYQNFSLQCQVISSCKAIKVAKVTRKTYKFIFQCVEVPKMNSFSTQLNRVGMTKENPYNT